MDTKTIRSKVSGKNDWAEGKKSKLPGGRLMSPRPGQHPERPKAMDYAEPASPGTNTLAKMSA